MLQVVTNSPLLKGSDESLTAVTEYGVGSFFRAFDLFDHGKERTDFS